MASSAAASICFTRPLVLGLGFLLCLVDHFAADLFGVTAALFEDRADLVAGGGQAALVVGQGFLGLLVGGLGLGDLLGDVPLALVEALGNRASRRTSPERPAGKGRPLRSRCARSSCQAERPMGIQVGRAGGRGFGCQGGSGTRQRPRQQHQTGEESNYPGAIAGLHFFLGP